MISSVLVARGTSMHIKWFRVQSHSQDLTHFWNLNAPHRVTVLILETEKCWNKFLCVKLCADYFQRIMIFN